MISRNKADILIIDDDLSTRKLIKKILERETYNALEAEDGNSALEALKKSNVDIIITDLLMSGMSGLELVRHLKDDPITAVKPVILYTSVSNHVTVQEAISQGISGYLIKPINANVLLKKVKECQTEIIPVLENQIRVSRRLGLDTRECMELLTLLVDDAKERLRVLGRKMESGEIKPFAQFVTELSTSAENLGAKRLYDAAEKTKIAASKSDNRGLIKYIWYIRAELENLRQAITPSSLNH